MLTGLRSIVLLTLCNKAVQLGLAGPGRKSLLRLIHDYLEARYVLLKNDEVVLSWSGYIYNSMLTTTCRKCRTLLPLEARLYQL